MRSDITIAVDRQRGPVPHSLRLEREPPFARVSVSVDRYDFLLGIVVKLALLAQAGTRRGRRLRQDHSGAQRDAPSA